MKIGWGTKEEQRMNEIKIKDKKVFIVYVDERMNDNNKSKNNLKYTY